MGYQQYAHLTLLLELVEEVEDLGLNGDIEGSGRLVGDEQFRFAGYGHSNHNALPHSARHLVRVFGNALGGVGYADFSQHFGGNIPGLGFFFFLMQPDCLDNLLADGINGIQAGHRLLENHRDTVPANGAYSLVGQFKEISAVEIYLAGNDFAGRVSYKTHNGQRGNAFATAAFTDEGKRLALFYRKADILNGTGNPGFGKEVHTKAFDV
jgi:hypothetical protein